jgi:carboxypeptidase Taq
MPTLESLQTISSELTQLSHILSLLSWDQEVMMPPAATAGRARQMAVLSTIIHRKMVSDDLRKLLEEAEVLRDSFNARERGLVRVMRRQHDQSRKLPEAFVAEFSSLTSQALPVWAEARRRSDFAVFRPLLEKIVTMCRQKADYLGYAEEPYDALLDLYEEGLLASRVRVLFERLKPFLLTRLRTIADDSPDTVLAAKELDIRKQMEFSEKLLRKIGYDFERGRQDQSVHPFSISLGHDDRRLTNRYNPSSFEFIFSALHEGGHALYEQGISAELAGGCLDEGVSLGIHEAQSRLWENIIGRSRFFWQHFYGELQKAFPEPLAHVELEQFYQAINAVRPGYIRVDADEVSYNLHVLVRFELESALFAGSIATADLPGLWQEKYQEVLGLPFADLPDADAKGVLQDVHWAHGSFGYFPTYTVGNLAAAQFWAAYCRFDPDWQQTVATGNLEKIRMWLRENIYGHGATFTPKELLMRVTGRDLSEEYFEEYIRNKYGE